MHTLSQQVELKSGRSQKPISKHILSFPSFWKSRIDYYSPTTTNTSENSTIICASTPPFGDCFKLLLSNASLLLINRISISLLPSKFVFSHHFYIFFQTLLKSILAIDRRIACFISLSTLVFIINSIIFYIYLLFVELVMQFFIVFHTHKIIETYSWHLSFINFLCLIFNSRIFSRKQNFELPFVIKFRWVIFLKKKLVFLYKLYLMYNQSNIL